MGEQSLERLRHVVGTSPRSADAYSALGMALVRDGEYRGSIAALRQAVGLSPRRAAAYEQLGYSLGTGDAADRTQHCFGHR